MRWAASLLVPFLFVAGCSAGARFTTPSATPTATPSPTKTVRGLELLLDGEPAGVRLIRRGIKDVEKLGLWKRLTRHLKVVKINAYAGNHNIPRDGHLADAIYGVMEARDGELGLSCDVVFYLSAIERELRLSRAGVLVREYPSERITFAMIVAHELGHCQRGPHGEKVARRWEHKVEHLLTR
jgi:hypothetical protein